MSISRSPVWTLTAEASVWTFSHFHLNLICSLMEQCGHWIWGIFFTFSKEPLWTVWTQYLNALNALLVCLCEWPFLLQSRRATRAPVQRRFPVWKAPHDTCGPVWMWTFDFSFVACSYKEPHRPVYEVFLFVCFCSLSEYWPFPLHFQSLAFLCHLFVFCRSQCEHGPIPIFPVSSLTVHVSFCSVCTKSHISVVLAQWRLVPPENTVLKMCSIRVLVQCAKCAKCTKMGEI